MMDLPKHSSVISKNYVLSNARNIVLLFAQVALTAWAVFFLPACNVPFPHMDIEVWAGNSKDLTIERKQESKEISTADPEFDNFGCMTYDDFKEVYRVLMQCNEWGGPLMTEDLKSRYLTDIKTLYR